MILSTSSSTESKEAEAAASHLACEECGFEAASSVGLKIHTSKKHEEIPQLDRESPYESGTDCWWINQHNESLKCFQKYIDVLKDKENSTLSKQEKTEEREKVTDGRKSAFVTISCGSLPGIRLNCSNCGFTSWSNA